MAISPQTIMTIMVKIPALVAAVESVLDMPGAGAQKAEAIQSAVTEMVSEEDTPDFLQKYWPKISGYISVLVGLYNLVGFFRRK